MDLSLSSRFKNAWNAFRNRAPTMMSQNIGSGYSYRPDRFRLTRGNERSIQEGQEIKEKVFQLIKEDIASVIVLYQKIGGKSK